MISGDVLKYRNGFLIEGRYETRLTGSSRFPLTMPSDYINLGHALPDKYLNLPQLRNDLFRFGEEYLPVSALLVDKT